MEILLSLVAQALKEKPKKFAVLSDSSVNAGKKGGGIWRGGGDVIQRRGML